MQVEIQELLAQIEVLSQEKVSIKKVVEKLEIQVHEYNVQIQDLNRTVADVTGAKQRMHMENQVRGRGEAELATLTKQLTTFPAVVLGRDQEAERDEARDRVRRIGQEQGCQPA